MTTFKVTLRVRDEMNRIRVQETATASPAQIVAAAERMAHSLQHTLQKLTASHRPNGAGKDRGTTHGTV